MSRSCSTSFPFGYYMEIEGPKEDILKAEKLLGADELVPEARGYPRLTLKFGKENKNGVDGVSLCKKDRRLGWRFPSRQKPFESQTRAMYGSATFAYVPSESST